MNKSFLLCMIFLLTVLITQGQRANAWNGKNAAVVLTYDDGLPAHLQHAIPALDSLGLKATFYIADYNRSLDQLIPKWRKASVKGHELANHTLYHPCEGGRPGREFVTAMYDLNNYTIARMDDEIRTMNTILKAIDGKTERTFAYPCGDMKIKDSAYLEHLRNQFVAARGVGGGIEQPDKVNLLNVHCYTVNGDSGEALIRQVKQAEAEGGLIVFLFHGVGGGHSLNVSLPAHSELLHYLKRKQKTIWVAPMIEVAKFIKSSQSH